MRMQNETIFPSWTLCVLVEIESLIAKVAKIGYKKGAFLEKFHRCVEGRLLSLLTRWVERGDYY